jgi:hypothetical protein
MKNATKSTAKKATKKTAAAAPVEAAPKATTKKAEKVESTDLAVHINPSGRVCFGKVAAARIGDLGFMKITVDGKLVRMIATATETETPIRRASGRPYVSATKQLKEAGIFAGTAVDLVATPYNHRGFDFKA